MSNYALYKKTFRHMNESKEFQTQKEIDLLNYCKGKTFPKDWTYIHEILRLNKLPRRDLAAPYLCLIAAAWSLTSTQDKIKQFHRQISYGCRNGETMYNNLNNWIRSLKEEDWFNPDEKMY